VRNTLTGRFKGDNEAIRQSERRGNMLCERLVGLQLDDATEIARGEGFVVREVSHRNGITALTADFQSDRITLFGDRDDLVIRAEYG